MTNAPSTSRGPVGRPSRKRRFAGESRSVVHRAAVSAIGLKRSPGSRPQTTLSWFPRIMAFCLRILVTFSMTALGSAPYPTKSPRITTRSCLRRCARASTAERASSFEWMSDRMRYRISGRDFELKRDPQLPTVIDRREHFVSGLFDRLAPGESDVNRGHSIERLPFAVERRRLHRAHEERAISLSDDPRENGVEGHVQEYRRPEPPDRATVRLRHVRTSARRDDGVRERLRPC